MQGWEVAPGLIPRIDSDENSTGSRLDSAREQHPRSMPCAGTLREGLLKEGGVPSSASHHGLLSRRTSLRTGMGETVHSC